MLIKEFKDRITYCCDPETIIEILELTVEDLVEAFEERVEEKLEEFDEMFDIMEGYGDE